MNPIERRLTALEGKTGEDGRIIYAATQEMADDHKAKTRTPNLYLVTGDHSRPLVDGGSVPEMMRNVAEHGWLDGPDQQSPFSIRSEQHYADSRQMHICVHAGRL